MYSSFLWRNAKGQSKSIIKRRWRWRTSKSCQISSQTSNLIQNIHQNLSLTRLNGQDMIQCTSNVWIIRGSRWRNISSSSSIRSLNNTCRKGRRGNTTRRCTSRDRRISSQLSSLCRRKVGRSGPTTCTGSPAGKSARPRNERILWMKIGYINACPMAELLWTSFKERRNKWGKLIDAPDMKA